MKRRHKRVFAVEGNPCRKSQLTVISFANLFNFFPSYFRTNFYFLVLLVVIFVVVVVVDVACGIWRVGCGVLSCLLYFACDSLLGWTFPAAIKCVQLHLSNSWKCLITQNSYSKESLIVCTKNCIFTCLEYCIPISGLWEILLNINKSQTIFDVWRNREAIVHRHSDTYAKP